jgi:DNA-binding transcriptional MerR regulator
VGTSDDRDARHLSIGEVLTQLQDEFPDITISKIRFLESQGLIDPERTPSGYRRFYPADLDRLRWILFQQREHFLPLRVIKERLDSFGSVGAPTESSNGQSAAPPNAGARGAGRARTVHPTQPPRPRAATPTLPFEAIELPMDLGDPVDDLVDEIGPLEPPEAADGLLSRAELLAAATLTPTQLDQLEEYGIVAPTDGVGTHARYDDEALDIAGIAAGFHARGIEARHLRMYRHLAERESALLGQVLVRYVRQRNPEARARLTEELEELSRLGRRLRTAMLRQALRDELAR